MSVEALSSDKQSLADEVQRLKEQLQQKKSGKTTGKGDNPKQNSDHSSEKQRRDRDKPQTSSAAARRTFKDLPSTLASSVPSIQEAAASG